MKSRTAIIGSSGHALVLADIIDSNPDQECVGWLDPSRIPGEWINGYAVLGSEMDIENIIEEHNVDGVIIGIGDNGLRRTVAMSLTGAVPNLIYHNAVHPSAVIASGVALGSGVAVMAGAVIGAGASLGAHCVINTSCSIDHEVALQEFSSIGPGAVVGGGCSIGAQTAVGIGATLRHNLKIGCRSVVGAGAVQLNDIGENEVWFGVPSRKVRKREDNERYL